MRFNKRLATLLFVIAASIFNIVLTVGIFALLFILVFNVILPPLGIADAASAFIVTGMGAASLFISFVIYRVILNIITTNVDMARRFAPLLPEREKKQPRPKKTNQRSAAPTSQ
jgi:hypothetical protein